MGLLRFSRFSSIPTLQRKIQSRREQKERYTLSFPEWGLLNGEQIIRNSRDNITPVTLYTVPAGRVLFVTEAFVSTGSASTNNTFAHIFIDVITRVILEAAARGTAALSQTFTKPIRVKGGESLISDSSGNSTTSAMGFNAFEIAESQEIV